MVYLLSVTDGHYYDKESRLLWVDEGRLELTGQPKREIDPADVASPRPGGVMDPAFYPSANHMVG